MASIIQNMQDVHANIVAAARNAGRNPQDIQLLAVSKTFDAHAVLEAVAGGQLAFGENYLQEALEKMAEVASLLGKNATAADLLASPSSEIKSRPAVCWHFIGPIQSNKTRPIAEQFDWVHSVERLKIAERLSDQRPAHMAPLNVCLQINISGEASKSGASIQEAEALAYTIAKLPRLRLRGLMAIPEAAENFDAQRAPFHQLRLLFERLVEGGLDLDCLSMGMSADMDAAIAEGATMVRIGSAIFGSRNVL